MTKRFFGTDGVRGKVGVEPITPTTVVKLGWALGKVMRENQGAGQILIGKDTRVSGYLLESAMEAGLSAAGMDVVLLGPTPTPAIAYLTRSARAVAGVVISASHNPFDDNGIKFFSGDGFKLNDDIELEIERLMNTDMQTVASEHLGKARRMNAAVSRYVEFCKNTVESQTHFRGLRIAIDCANGAAYQTAPQVFRELGAETYVINNEPDGFNINHRCGSTHIEELQKTVVEQKCDLGVAFDGDADRVLMVDRLGNVVDGDQLLYVLAASAKQEGSLAGGVVGTLMTNYGLEKKFEEIGVDFVRANVGDRYVLRELLDRGWVLGGESSGHLICLDKTTTGDGLVAALQVIEKLINRQQSLDEIVSELTIFPQRMINVQLSGGQSNDAQQVCAAPTVIKAIESAEKTLSDSGRILLRPSGTEPLIRVMVEGRDTAVVDRCCEQVADVVQQAAN